MKIIKRKETATETITIRLPASLLNEIDNIAVKNKISRQKLISRTLQKAIRDKKFVLEI